MTSTAPPQHTHTPTQPNLQASIRISYSRQPAKTALPGNITLPPDERHRAIAIVAKLERCECYWRTLCILWDEEGNLMCLLAYASVCVSITILDLAKSRLFLVGPRMYSCTHSFDCDSSRSGSISSCEPQPIKQLRGIVINVEIRTWTVDNTFCYADPFTPQPSPRSSTGASSCTSCPAAQTSNSAKTTCVCAVGHYEQDILAARRLESNNDQPKDDGNRKRQLDYIICVACSAGKYQNQIDQTNCKNCPTGRYAVSTTVESGSSSCCCIRTM